MQAKPNLNRRYNILVLTFFSACILGLLIRSGYLVLTGINNFDPRYGSGLAASILEALAMLFVAGLLLPILAHSIKQLKEREILPTKIRPVKFWQVAVLFITWALVVVGGAMLASMFTYGWALAAPLFLVGISLPILVLIRIGAGGLPIGSRHRLWSVFGFGMLGGTGAAMLLEYLLVGIAIVVIGILSMANPELRTAIDQIKTMVTSANAGDIQTLLTVLAPYITNPLVILSIMVFASVLTPLIEEAVKPAVLWFLGKRLQTPAEGFALGVLCGAGFAMMEGLLAASGASQMWGYGLAGRAAASLMHITGSGLVGWGIASAQLEKRYGRLALNYLAAVSIHGIWNGSAILAVYGALHMMAQNMRIDRLGILTILGGLGMLLLELFVMLVALPRINRTLRRTVVPIPTTMHSDIIAPLTTSDPRDTNGLDS